MCPKGTLCMQTMHLAIQIVKSPPKKPPKFAYLTHLCHSIDFDFPVMYRVTHQLEYEF